MATTDGWRSAALLRLVVAVTLYGSLHPVQNGGMQPNQFRQTRDLLPFPTVSTTDDYLRLAKFAHQNPPPGCRLGISPFFFQAGKSARHAPCQPLLTVFTSPILAVAERLLDWLAVVCGVLLPIEIFIVSVVARLLPVFHRPY